MNMRSWAGLGLLAAMSGGLGCSGTTRIGDDSGGGAAGQSKTDGLPSTLDLTPPANTCPAACEDPAGTVLERFDGIEQFYQHIVGRWRVCSGVNTFIGPDDIVGVEYEAPTLTAKDNGSLWQGNMYYLVEGPGGPERGKGFDYQLKYDVGPQVGGTPNSLNMTSNGTFVAHFRYSPCPRQWLLNGYQYPEGALLVPLD